MDNNKNKHQQAIDQLIRMFSSQDHQKVVDLGLKYIKIFKDSHIIHNILGTSFSSMAESAKAEYHYKQSIKISPKTAITYTNYANLLRNIGRIDESIVNYKKSIELNPKHYKAYNNLAITLHDKGQLHDARVLLEQAIEIEEKNFLAFYNIANVYRDLGLVYAAIENYEKAKDRNKDHLPIYNNLGLALFNIGKYEEAILEFEFVIDRDPKNSASIQNLSSCYRAIGEFDKALKYNSLSFDLNTDKKLIDRLLTNRGGIEFDSGLFDESVLSNKKALEINPKAYSTYDNQCLGFQKTGKYEELKETYNSLYKNLDGSPKIKSIDESINRILDKMDNVVALIKNSGRTGSIFLHSLLDGHPEIITTPGVYFKGFFHPEVWDLLYVGKNNSNWKKILVSNFISMYDSFFDAKSLLDVPGKPMSGPPGYSSGLTTLGKNKDISLKLDKEKFGQYLFTFLEGYEEMTRATFFKLIHLAYNATIKRNLNPTLLFFHIHNPTFVESAQFLKDFPNARFLQIIREPIQALESWCKIEPKITDITNMEHEENNKFINKFAIVLNYLNNQILDKSKANAVIRLEDLKKEPTGTLKKLADWLGIKYIKNLQEPSFEGNYYWGISNTTPDVKGFSTESVDRKPGIFFSSEDIARIKPLFGVFNYFYNYDNLEKSKHKKDLEIVLRELDKPFDFEEKVLKRTKGDELSVDVQKTYLRILMKHIIEEIKKEDKYEKLRNMI